MVTKDEFKKVTIGEFKKELIDIVEEVNRLSVDELFEQIRKEKKGLV